MTKRRSFTRAFKLEAVRLLESGDKKAALARELEVPRNCLYKWQEQLKAKGKGGVFPGARASGRPRPRRTLKKPGGRGNFLWSRRAAFSASRLFVSPIF